ncbi:MAG: TRAP transporter large permease subunit [Proteobacteria bacterium]|nr:TRAP transporter large permease subunit [Pseudomonadota bacterium]
MQSAQRTPLFHRLENALAVAVLALIVALPVVELAGREFFETGIPGSISIVQHMTLWVTFVGAALAARSERLLALATAEFLPASWRAWIELATAWLAVAVGATLVAASVQLVRVDFEYGDRIAWGIPVWIVSLVMPAALAVITWRVLSYATKDWGRRLLVASGLAVPLILDLVPLFDTASLLLPGIGVLVLGTAFGLPIFAAIGGAAALLFFLEGTPIAAVPGEAYRMATSPMLPAIPLFTLAGYILAAGRANQRLLSFFTSLVGWLPGGLAVVVTLLLAFFTPLTGASGITILAIGGLLLPMLTKAHYPEQHSLGLVTSAGSIGVLLPPSLPVILYAYYAELQLDRLFIGGLLPGLLLIAVVAAWGAWRGWYKGAERTPFHWRKLGCAAWSAKWELLLPFIIIGGIFGGLATLVEAAALTVLYAFIVETLVCRELKVSKDLPRIAVESATMVGGFMIILSMALGLTNYLIIAQVPQLTLSWVTEVIESPLLFLLALNLLLIVVGALMDIYSAIIVIVPLIAPMASVYMIDPVHLGIIFMANMQLGYLMPPMGENLFLSAYRFKKSLPQIYLATIPYVVILLITVLLITYLPAMTLGLLDLLER